MSEGATPASARRPAKTVPDRPDARAAGLAPPTLVGAVPDSRSGPHRVRLRLPAGQADRLQLPDSPEHPRVDTNDGQLRAQRRGPELLRRRPAQSHAPRRGGADPRDRRAAARDPALRARACVPLLPLRAVPSVRPLDPGRRRHVRNHLLPERSRQRHHSQRWAVGTGAGLARRSVLRAVRGAHGDRLEGVRIRRPAVLGSHGKHRTRPVRRRSRGRCTLVVAAPVRDASGAARGDRHLHRDRGDHDAELGVRLHLHDDQGWSGRRDGRHRVSDLDPGFRRVEPRPGIGDCRPVARRPAGASARPWRSSGDCSPEGPHEAIDNRPPCAADPGRARDLGADRVHGDDVAEVGGGVLGRSGRASGGPDIREHQYRPRRPEPVDLDTEQRPDNGGLGVACDGRRSPGGVPDGSKRGMVAERAAARPRPTACGPARGARRAAVHHDGQPRAAQLQARGDPHLRGAADTRWRPT